MNIDVICIVVPSGKNLWVKAEEGSKYITKVIREWKDQNPEYQDMDCTIGCVRIRMPSKDYMAIETNNLFHWPKK